MLGALAPAAPAQSAMAAAPRRRPAEVSARPRALPLPPTEPCSPGGWVPVTFSSPGV